MNNEENDKIYNKWSSIIHSMGVTGSKADWLSEYANKQIKHSEEFPSLLPVVMRIAAQTIGQDLVTVQPMESINHREMDRIKSEVKAENRERKIDALTENEEFNEMKIEDHPDYKTSGPSGQLFFLDFKYGTASN